MKILKNLLKGKVGISQIPYWRVHPGVLVFVVVPVCRKSWARRASLGTCAGVAMCSTYCQEVKTHTKWWNTLATPSPVLAEHSQNSIPNSPAFWLRSRVGRECARAQFKAANSNECDHQVRVPALEICHSASGRGQVGLVAHQHRKCTFWRVSEWPFN